MPDIYAELFEAFFTRSDEPDSEGWQQVTNWDAWTHPETGDVISGHQMRLCLRMGLVPKTRVVAGKADRPWL